VKKEAARGKEKKGRYFSSREREFAVNDSRGAWGNLGATEKKPRPLRGIFRGREATSFICGKAQRGKNISGERHLGNCRSSRVLGKGGDCVCWKRDPPLINLHMCRRENNWRVIYFPELKDEVTG